MIKYKATLFSLSVSQHHIGGNIGSHLLVFRFNFGSMSSSSDGFRRQLPLLLTLTATSAHTPQSVVGPPKSFAENFMVNFMR